MKALKNAKKWGFVLAMMAAYCCVLTSVSSFLFSIILGNCYKTESLLLFVGGMGCCAGGYFSSQLTQNKKMAARIVCYAGTVIAGVLFMYFLFIWSQSSSIAAFCALLFLAMGWLIQKSSFSKLSSNIAIVVCLAVNIAVYFFSYLITKLLKHLVFYQFPYQTYIFLIFPMLLILLLFRNQSNLDELMTYGRKHIAKSSSNNSMSVTFTIGVVGIIFLLYLVSGPAVSLITFVGSYLKYGLDLFLQWFFKLVSSDRDPPWEPDDPAALREGPPAEPWMMVVMGILLAAIAIVMLIVLINSFPAIREAIVSWWRNLKKKLFKGKVVSKTENEYFYDNITDIDRDTHTGTQGAHFKRWGTFARAYRHTKDPVEQIRLCYGYVLHLLRETDEPPLDSDTPLEILHKMLQKKGVRQKVDLSGITTIYSDVRYAMLVPDMGKNEQMFSEVKAISKRLKLK